MGKLVSDERREVIESRAEKDAAHGNKSNRPTGGILIDSPKEEAEKNIYDAAYEKAKKA